MSGKAWFITCFLALSNLLQMICMVKLVSINPDGPWMQLGIIGIVLDFLFFSALAVIVGYKIGE